MTCAAILASIDDTRLTTTERVIFGNIVKGYQTRASIAKATGCAESSVPRAVRKLEALGYLKRVFHDGKANTYEVLAQRDTGITNDTGIATSRTKRTRGIAEATGVSPPADTGEGRRADTPEDAEFVDNDATPISTGARAETPNLNTSSELELNLQTPEQHQPASARAAPVKVLNGTAKTLPTPQLAAIIVKHVNSRMLDPSKYGELNTTTARIKVWMDAGADFDADILPAIRDGCAWLESNGEPARRWKAFDKFVTGATKRRLSAEAPMLPITPSETRNEHAARTTRTTDGMDVRTGPVSPGTALLMRKIAGGKRDDERRVEPHAGK